MVGLSGPVQCKCLRAGWIGGRAAGRPGGRAGKRVAETGLGLVLLITTLMTVSFVWINSTERLWTELDAQLE